ncbi:MAG: trypco2 family protein [Nostoc sp.]|uniref:trypco2 family protein n=1 Tax=Nostoc sp. TaxID=1180 RepID=UPI002FF77C26
MSTEIGLAELIQQVKQELLTTYPGKENDTPIFSVDSVELELQVTVQKDTNGKVKINIFGWGGEAGGKASRDDVQKVKVKLSPLLSKEYLLKAYYGEDPKRWPGLVKKNLDGLLKGSEGKNLNEDFGS